jgi:integrase
MPTIRNRGPYQFQAIVKRKGYPSQAKTFNTRREAEIWARQIEAQIDRGLYISTVEAEKTTMGALFDKYEKEIIPTLRGNHAKATIVALRRGLASLAPVALTPKVVSNYRDKRLETVKGETVRKELGTLSKVIQIAGREWDVHLPSNPVSLVSKPAPSRPRDRRLNEGEAERLEVALAQCNSSYLLPLFRLAIETAMRQGELLGLMCILAAGMHWREKQKMVRIEPFH